eukprot:TRINITY_DN3945_c0_g1_i2.p1 TRINITY_DN3945_c0_g1~~TRINITY_DN3945_c0_g1_i2.p1  ORF type:complete len:668 (+),score=112.99 TRINITY_DN3945_c0_g1_i2:644-2647(+)
MPKHVDVLAEARERVQERLRSHASILAEVKMKVLARQLAQAEAARTGAAVPVVSTTVKPVETIPVSIEELGLDPEVQKQKALQMARANALAEQGAKIAANQVCAFGRDCKRPDCGFLHPDGRAIGEVKEAENCRFDAACTRPNCFYKHPNGRPLGRDNFEIFIDELEMPKRPGVNPSTEEREVFVDPFPCSPDTPEFETFTAAFGGEAEKVFQIPGQERGYILFKDHRSAKACVKAGAGTWSEAERCTTSRRGRDRNDRGKKGKALSAYHISLPFLIRGEAPDYKVDELREKAGLEGRLRFNTPADGPARFEGQATAAKKEALKTLLVDHLAAAHEKISERLTEIWVKTGLPKDIDEEKAKALFEQYGECASIVLMNVHENAKKEPSARVVYSNWQDAARAKQELHNATLFEVPIICQLKTPEPNRWEDTLDDDGDDDDGELTGYEHQDSVSCPRKECAFQCAFADISSAYCPECKCRWNKAILVETRRRRATMEGSHDQTDENTASGRRKSDGARKRGREDADDEEEAKREERWNGRRDRKRKPNFENAEDDHQRKDSRRDDWSNSASVPEPLGPPPGVHHPVPHPYGYPPPPPPGSYAPPGNFYPPAGSYLPPPPPGNYSPYAYPPPPPPQKTWMCTLCGMDNDPADEVCGGGNAYLGCKDPRPW